MGQNKMNPVVMSWPEYSMGIGVPGQRDQRIGRGDLINRTRNQGNMKVFAKECLSTREEEDQSDN